MTFTTNACPSGAESAWDTSPLGHELREYPRIALEIPVAFRNADGQHCAAQLKNLSANGMQVRCNVATAQMIHPRGGRLQAENQPLLHATALLPLATGAETLSIGVRLLYSATLDDELRVVLGFQFLSLRPKARRLIEAFVSEHGQFRLRDEAAYQDHAA